MRIVSVCNHCKYAIKAKIPVMLWGPPGVGKSSIVHQIAEEFGYINKNTGHNNVIDLRLAQLDPTDLRGVPMPNRETMRSEWYLPAFWPERATKAGRREVMNEDGTITIVEYKAGECPDGPGIVFLDELDKAPVSVKNASLQFVLDRKLGSYKLPDDWAIVGAGNREEDGCFSQPLGTTLENRMIHYDVEAKLDDWADWARTVGKIQEDIIGFLYLKPDLLHKFTGEHAFPTPRSWEIGSRLLEHAKGSKEQKELLASAVGTAAAQEFTVWQNVYRSVDPEAVFRGEMPDFESKKEDASFRYAVTLAVAFALNKRKGGIKKAEKHIANFLRILSSELRVIFLRTQTYSTLDSMMKHEEFQAFIKEVMKIVS